MIDYTEGLAGKTSWFRRYMNRLPSLAIMRGKMSRLRLLIPLGLVTLVVLYEIGPSRWIYFRSGFAVHLLVEILLFGTVGPALAFVILDIHQRWLEEKDTSDFQSQLLNRAHQDVEKGRQLNDDAMQTLFSAGILISSLKSDQPDQSAERVAEIEATEEALDQAMQRLRSHLLSQNQVGYGGACLINGRPGVQDPDPNP